MLKNVNKADVSHSQCYSYGKHFTLYLIFFWVWDDLTIFPAYTESKLLIWALSHYSMPCQTPKIFWQKFSLGNYIIGYVLLLFLANLESERQWFLSLCLYGISPKEEAIIVGWHWWGKIKARGHVTFPFWKTKHTYSFTSYDSRKSFPIWMKFGVQVLRHDFFLGSKSLNTLDKYSRRNFETKNIKALYKNITYIRYVLEIMYCNH
jgi:hypothetical protein